MVSIYDVKKSKIRGEEKPLILVELRGLSTDTKPTVIQNGEIENGSSFIEINTGKVYLYDASSKSWNEV